MRKRKTRQWMIYMCGMDVRGYGEHQVVMTTMRSKLPAILSARLRGS